MAMFPYTLGNLFGGAVRFLYAPLSVAVPDDLSDIIDLTSPYVPKTGWVDGGATGGPFTYGRNITKSGYDIQQSTATVLEDVTEITRDFGVTLAEFTPELMAIFEESTGVDSVAAGANKSAQSRVPFGNVTSLTPYRVAFIGRRKKAQGSVVEPGGVTRGPLVGWVGYRTEVAAENASISVGEGDMATAPISFRCYPESTISAEGEEHGFFITESTGTISAS